MPAVLPHPRLGRALTTAAAVTAGLALSGCGLLAGSAFDLKVGDCLATVPDGEEINDADTIDCAEPHEAEVYAEHQLSGDTYPGEKETDKEADSFCRSELEALIDDNDDAELSYTFLMPTEDSWNNMDDRAVTCMVVDLDGTTGSLTNSEA
ncbi:hypothetical protein HNR23_001321 [Nocardiopsis mwathae]|uniref:Septum formation-related domain-containing protein n=1 Tax=Nocardiopsis mwathae TaxID=1472723 RepID=A0A7X0D512_9ACTN|nr:septum formation family protein [Nocardiopsis mwathae]MBB6171261.1 hypothetical protein [Nocardiopsis mwathae]